MKSLTKILMLFCLALLLTGCGDKPATVTEKFLTTVAKGNFEEAKKYATKGTGELLDFVAVIAKAEKEKAANSGKDFKFVLIREEISGDTATVYYKEGIDKEEKAMTLIKQDDKWKVDMPKQ